MTQSLRPDGRISSQMHASEKFRFPSTGQVPHFRQYRYRGSKFPDEYGPIRQSKRRGGRLQSPPTTYDTRIPRGMPSTQDENALGITSVGNATAIRGIGSRDGFIFRLYERESGGFKHGLGRRGRRRGLPNRRQPRGTVVQSKDRKSIRGRQDSLRKPRRSLRIGSAREARSLPQDTQIEEER